MQTSSVCLRRQLPRRGKPRKGELRRALLQREKPRKERIAQSTSTERNAEKETKDSRGVGKGKAGKRLVRRLEQTSSVCLRRQLPRRGKPGKGELRRALLQRGKTRKERKTAAALVRAKPRGAGTIPQCAGIKIDEVYTHIRLRIRGNRFCKAIL